MSQVKLNLQPPPNVDFVTGYPGIPPGPDRPQASVKGAIEVRVPAAGVKAKWVRIELRKVETLPGGGEANTYYDFVGPSPVNLWSTSDEYSLLRSQDFPFSIRIPESIPPSITLESRAGIAYELVASVCTKGKKGFLRKAKSVVVSTSSPIIIDKHELHSTWPVYCQPEKRHMAQDGVNLIVERNNTCYGPGDQITVKATVKSDSLHTVILRGFEFYLKEATVYRAGIHSQGKRSAPQVKQMNISESKLPVNATLYGGTSHTSDLSCIISADHTTTTLNAARHIDVTYTLCIKALMGTGTHLVMDLPVIISNWQRHVSFEAINRIGAVPNLSLMSPTQTQALAAAAANNRGRPADVVAATLPTNRAAMDIYGHTRNPSAAVGAFNTLPGGSSSTAQPSIANANDNLGYGGATSRIDDFGAIKPALSSNNTLSGGSSVTTAPAISALPITTSTSSTSAPTARRPNSASGGGGTRFTITNAQPQEIPQQEPPVLRQRSAQAAGVAAVANSASQKLYLSAEEEKKLYEQAIAKVAKVQPHAIVRAASPPLPSPSGTSALPPGAAKPHKNHWLPADEEKRLYQQAQEAAQRTQQLGPQQQQQQMIPQATVLGHKKNTSDPKSQPLSSGSIGSKLSGADMYAQAINAQNRKQQQQQTTNTTTTTQASAAGGSVAPSPAKPSKPSVTQYRTAAQEKEELRRYEEAMRAVHRMQSTIDDDDPPPPPPPPAAAASTGPVAYESLFPATARGAPPAAVASSSHPAAAAAAAPPPPADAPPPFESAAGGSNIMAHLDEKERLRKRYEAQDAAAFARQNNNANAAPPIAYSPPAPALAPAPAPAPSPAPAAAGPLPGPYVNALEEKEALRRKFEERDKAARANSTSRPPPPPLRSNSVASQPSLSPKTNGSSSPGRSPSSATTGSRPAPVPPGNTGSGSSRVLTAVEEKALLRAKYEARDAGHSRKSPPPPSTTIPNGSSTSTSTNASITNGITTAVVAPTVTSTPSTPPPLMPRPPVEYIKETQEEDARLSRLNGQMQMPVLDGGDPRPTVGVVNRSNSVSSSFSPLPPSGAGVSSSSSSSALDMKPFTPFRAGFDVSLPGPPPPLPQQ